jgi:hypothetical protein
MINGAENRRASTMTTDVSGYHTGTNWLGSTFTITSPVVPR